MKSCFLFLKLQHLDFQIKIVNDFEIRNFLYVILFKKSDFKKVSK